MSEPVAPARSRHTKEEKVTQKTSTDPPTWLIGYNLLSGCLWSFVFLNVFATYLTFGNLLQTFDLTHYWTTAIQCCAIIEVINAATGVVKSPVITTAMQVASRLLVVLGVWTVLPEASGNTSYAYLTVHFAWGVAEVVRYYYYANHLISQQRQAPGIAPPQVPKFLLWLRYNAFLVLYPMGISSECYMVYRAVGAALARGTSGFTAYALFLCIVLIAYVPGTVVLFSHMLHQRAKQQKTLKTKKVDSKSE